jgi:hypothetical protein
MSSLAWSHVFLFFHLMAAVSILALPIAVAAVLRELTSHAYAVAVQPAQWVGRVHWVSMGGVGLALVTGVLQMWAFGIGWDALLNTQHWLLIKLVLVTLLILNGALFAGPVIRRLEALVREVGPRGSPTPSQEMALKRGTTLFLISSGPQAVLLLSILILAIIKPF